MSTEAFWTREDLASVMAMDDWRGGKELRSDRGGKDGGWLVVACEFYILGEIWKETNLVLARGHPGKQRINPPWR